MNEQKNEGKMKILQMLSEGTIGVEDAMKLLEQFKEEGHESARREGRPPRPPRPPRPERPRRPERPHVYFGHVHGNGPDPRRRPEVDVQDGSHKAMSFAESIGEKISGALSKLDNLDIDIDFDFSDVFGTKHRYSNTVTYISDPIAQNIASLRLMGKNATVKIEGYDGKELRITCAYKSKRPDAQVTICEEHGGFEVQYDYNAMYSMEISCEVPQAFVEEIHAESKNSGIKLHGINGRTYNILTKNGGIKLEKVRADEITAKTRNSSIQAEEVTADTISLETSNSKINAEYITANVAHFVTSNSKVETEDLDIKQLYIKTSNSAIKMENIFQNFAETGGERTVEAHTSNGGVSIYIPRNVAATLQASTTNSRVDCHLQDLLVGDVSKNYINGRTHDYDNAMAKAKINISTTNGTIKIREA